MRVVDVTATISERATELRARYGFRTPDAIHLATAIEANFTAADVRSRGLSAERINALREAVKAVSGVSMVDERDGAAPCFHLGL